MEASDDRFLMRTLSNNKQTEGINYCSIFVNIEISILFCKSQGDVHTNMW